MRPVLFGLVLACGVLGCIEQHPGWTPGTGATGSTDEPGGMGTGDTGTRTSSDGTGTTGCGASEVCDGVDNDCDGLVDEVSPMNEACGSCILLQHQGSAYSFCTDGLTFDEAQSACEGIGSNLASILDADADAFVGMHIMATSWMGATDRATEGIWVWNDGAPWDFTAWGANEPNNRGDEDCLERRAGGWNDEGCTEVRQYICRAPHTL